MPLMRCKRFNPVLSYASSLLRGPCDFEDGVSALDGFAILFVYRDFQAVSPQQPAQLGNSGNHSRLFGQDLRRRSLIHRPNAATVKSPEPTSEDSSSSNSVRTEFK